MPGLAAELSNELASCALGKGRGLGTGQGAYGSYGRLERPQKPEGWAGSWQQWPWLVALTMQPYLGQLARACYCMTAVLSMLAGGEQPWVRGAGGGLGSPLPAKGEERGPGGSAQQGQTPMPFPTREL